MPTGIFTPSLFVQVLYKYRPSLGRFQLPVSSLGEIGTLSANHLSLPFMAVYAVGDLQGCLTPLQRLLDQVNFDPSHDRLWLVGDLVNRGPDSLACLRFVKNLGDSARVVLGNHDLHLLAVDAGIRRCKPKDSLQPILDAEDRQSLMNWLRHQPLLHVDPQLKVAMCHAGIAPAWTLEDALREAAAVEAVLQADDYVAFLNTMYGDTPDQWHGELAGHDRLRYAVNAFTRMRFVYADGRLEFHQKGPPDSVDDALQAWFRYPKRRWDGPDIVFGHWSALGYQRSHGCISLDTGCVWGQSMTLLRLDVTPQRVTQVACDRL